MVDYTKFLKNARSKYLPTVCFNVQLPPIKEDCTCTSGSDSVLSIVNSPLDYCAECDNRGYVETKVQHDITGTMVDFASDSLQQKNQLTEDEASMFGRQAYVIHANLDECATTYYNRENCFDIAKHVEQDGVLYKIFAVNKSTLLGQVRVVIYKKN
jgi:hypothetical protein